MTIPAKSLRKAVPVFAFGSLLTACAPSPSANGPEQVRVVSTSTASVASDSVGPSTSLTEPNFGIDFFPTSTGRQEQGSPTQTPTGVNTAVEMRDETAKVVTGGVTAQKAEKTRSRFRNERQKSFAEERDSFDGVDVSSDSGSGPSDRGGNNTGSGGGGDGAGGSDSGASWGG